MGTKEKENPFVLSKEFIKVGEGIYVKEFPYYYMYIFVGPPYSCRPEKANNLDDYSAVECSVYEKAADNTLGILMNAKRLNFVGVGLSVKRQECVRVIITIDRLADLSKDLVKAKKLPKRIGTEIRPEFTEQMKDKLFKFITLRLFAYAGNGDEPKINWFANEAREIASVVMRMSPEHRTVKAINNIVYCVLYFSCCIMWTTDGRYEYCDPDEVSWRIKEKKDYLRLATEIKFFVDRLLKVKETENAVKNAVIETLVPNTPNDTDGLEASINSSG